jgi:hypothetical protein
VEGELGAASFLVIYYWEGPFQSCALHLKVPLLIVIAELSQFLPGPYGSVQINFYPERVPYCTLTYSTAMSEIGVQHLKLQTLK